MSELVYDVVIVGAGLSGLQATVTIHNAGLSYLVLEARDRVGGRTWTARSSTGVTKAELGAAWINDTNQSHMWALAQELGLHTLVQNTKGDVVVQDFDGGLVKFPYGEVPKYSSEQDTASCLAIRDVVEQLSTSKSPSIFSAGPHRRKLDSISLETFLHQSDLTAKAIATVQVWTHAMLGMDPSEVSVLCFIEYCAAGGGLMNMRSDGKGGGQALRIQEGTSAFSEGLAHKLKPDSIKLNNAVAEIHQSSNGQVVITTKGTTSHTYKARKVILSIPTPLYKTIKFSPPLPAAKIAFTNRTRYGFYTKYIINFSKAFWTETGLCGLAQSFVGPVSVFRDTSLNKEHPAMTCFIGGTFGRQWAAQDDAAKKASILKQIGHVFADGQDVSGYVQEVFESPWMQEEFSGWGCPCASTPPGVLGDGWDALCAPFGDVVFVGTELSKVWRGYMEGAVRTGKDGASQVIAQLREAQVPRPHL